MMVITFSNGAILHLSLSIIMIVFAWCALFAFAGCADDDEDLITDGNADINLLPEAKPNG